MTNLGPSGGSKDPPGPLLSCAYDFNSIDSCVENMFLILNFYHILLQLQNMSNCNFFVFVGRLTMDLFLSVEEEE